jgi:hypothetical protein
MIPFKVRKFPRSRKEPLEDYQVVKAQTPKEAAEKFYGGPLSEEGTIKTARVFVRPPMGYKGAEVSANIVFYEIV